MWLFWALAFMAGVAGVIQQGVTKNLSEKAGLAAALHVSNLVVLIGGIVILSMIAAYGQGEFAKLLKFKFEPRTWSWWFLLPGICGLFFITVGPIVIMKLGALKLFVAIVFAQTLGGAIWDRVVEGTPLDKWRVLGAFMTLVGAGLVSMSKTD